MLKLTILLIALAAVCHSQFSLLGGYVSRPDLIQSDLAKVLTVYAVEVLAGQQNIFLKNFEVTDVKVQLVNGLNYKIKFNAEPANPAFGSKTTCEVTIWVGNNEKSFISGGCETS